MQVQLCKRWPPYLPQICLNRCIKTRCCRAIRCKRYFVARQLLDEDIYHLSDTGLNATDFLLYHYYGGLVCIALKQYPKAPRLLEAAITTPTNVPDAIIVSAWQRYQIITALLTGAQWCHI